VIVTQLLILLEKGINMDPNDVLNLLNSGAILASNLLSVAAQALSFVLFFL
jgi:hypothetical protein